MYSFYLYIITRANVPIEYILVRMSIFKRILLQTSNVLINCEDVNVLFYICNINDARVYISIIANLAG